MSAYCHSIAERCDYPGDVSLSDDVDVIRWDHGRLFINGYRTAFFSTSPLGLEGLAEDVLNVVFDPVPPALVAPFAEEVIARLGPSWVMMSSDVEAWVERQSR